MKKDTNDKVMFWIVTIVIFGIILYVWGRTPSDQIYMPNTNCTETC